MADITVPIIPRAELTFGEKLGEGGFGVVYKGNWQHGGEVAIKQIKGEPGEDAIQEFRKEAGIMAHLNSPYIIRLFGICWQPGNYAIVMELMPNASLFHVLRNQQGMPWNVRSGIARDIAYGLRFLHTRKILHRDLKSLNVLLDDRLQAKLADFGLAEIKYKSIRSLPTLPTSKPSSNLIGSIAWMAPELFDQKYQHSFASDVYAYGMTSWELATRDAPYRGDKKHVVIANVQSGKRPKIPLPPNCPETFAELITACWSQDPNARPMMDTVINSLENIIQAEQSHDTSPTPPRPTPQPPAPVGPYGREVGILLQRIAGNVHRLTSIDLHNQRLDQQLGPAGAKFIAGPLASSSTVISLDLSNNYICDIGARALAQVLATNKTLAVLDLSNNNIGYDGAKALAVALASNSTLTTLILRGNRIGDRGVIEIARVLSSNQALTLLDLRSNTIRQNGAHEIAKALQTNKALTALVLGDNEIGDVGAVALAGALKINSTLTSIDLDNNYIGTVKPNVGQILVDALTANHTLIFINLAKNKLKDEVIVSIQHVMRINQAKIFSAGKPSQKVIDTSAAAAAAAPIGGIDVDRGEIAGPFELQDRKSVGKPFPQDPASGGKPSLQQRPSGGKPSLQQRPSGGKPSPRP